MILLALVLGGLGWAGAVSMAGLYRGLAIGTDQLH